MCASAASREATVAVVEAPVRNGVLEAKDHFLAKPFTPTSVIQKVRDVLDAPREPRPRAADATP